MAYCDALDDGARKRLNKTIDELRRKQTKLSLPSNIKVEQEEENPNDGSRIPLFQFDFPEPESGDTKSAELLSDSQNQILLNNAHMMVIEADDPVIVILSICLGKDSTCISCRFCSLSATDVGHLARHIYIAHSSEADRIRNEALQFTTFMHKHYNSTLDFYSCPFPCSFICPRLDALKEHFKSGHKEHFRQILEKLKLNHHLTFLCSVPSPSRPLPKAKLVDSKYASRVGMASAPDSRCTICGYTDSKITKTALAAHMMKHCSERLSVSKAALLNCLVNWTEEGFMCVYCLEKLSTVSDASHHIQQAHKVLAAVVESEISELFDYLSSARWVCPKEQLATQAHPPPWACEYNTWPSEKTHQLSVHLQLMHMSSFRHILARLKLQGYLDILNMKQAIMNAAKPVAKDKLTISLMPPSLPVTKHTEAFPKCVLCGFIDSNVKQRWHLNTCHINSRSGMFHLCFRWKDGSYECLYCAARGCNILHASQHMSENHVTLVQSLVDESAQLHLCLKQSEWKCEDHSNCRASGQWREFPWDCRFVSRWPRSFIHRNLPLLTVHLLVVHCNEFKSILGKLRLKAHLDLLHLRDVKLPTIHFDSSADAEHIYHNRNSKALSTSEMKKRQMIQQSVTKYPERTAPPQGDVKKPIQIVVSPTAKHKVHRRYSCPCKSLPLLPTVADWAKHLEVEHLETWRLTECLDSESTRTVFQCPRNKCGFKTDDRNAMRYHIYTQHLR